MRSLKRPSSSYVASSQRASSTAAASTSRLQKTRQHLPESEDLFCSSDDDNQSLQSKKSPQKSQKSTKYQDKGLFTKILTGAGLVLQTGDLPNVLSCDQAKFQRSLNKALNCGSLLSSSSTSHAAQATTEVTQVLSGLEAYLKLPLRLKWSLLYTETDPACEVANRGNQDSLIRLLLNVDALQPSLVTLLTDTLLTLAYEQNDGKDSNLPALLLGNLRWLDHVVEPEKLSDAVLLVLQAATTEVQKEIIAFLPNIVTDQFHPATADALTELYSQTPALVPAILDALLHLTLDEDSLEEVHHTVLKTLHAAQPHHLPCVLRFLLHNTNSSLAYQVLSDVREKLHIPSERDMLPPPPPSQRSLAPRTVSNNASENADLGVLIFSTIKMALLLHKYLTNAWLKAIDDVEYSSTRNVDLLVLVLVHDAVPSRRRAVHSILRNKIRAGLQYDALLKNTLADNPAVMREYFDSIKKLAGMMIRSPEPAFCQFGVTLYSVVFEVSSGGLQQEVVVSLLAHLGDDQHVRLAALTLLASLAHQHTHAMARFAIFLKSSLEQLERLSLQESRCLLDAVSAVAASDPDTALHADLAIHTRKLLNHSDIRYKRLGVLSAVLTLKNSHDPNASTSSSGSGGSLTGAGCGEDVLEVVWACTAHSPPASALFMDELASTILRDGINTRLERWLSSKLEEGFESVFIQDLESDTPPLVTRHTDLQLDLAFDLEVEEQAVIALNLGVLVEKLEAHRREEKTNTRSVAADSLSSGAAATHQDTILLTLAPHFRLLRMLVSHLNAGELSAIDGLLGCPIYYPKKELLVPDTFATLSKEKQSVLLSCLFFAANWFRELVNAFVTQKTQELKKKVYSRLRNLLEVEQSLSMLLPLSPSYCPHLAASHIDPATAPPPPPAAAAPVAGTAKRGRKPKAKKKSKSSTTAADVSTLVMTQASQLPASIAPSQLPDATQLQQEAKQTDQKKRTADLSLYKAYLRELHLDVFCLLFKTMSLDPEMENASNQLSIPEAEFLLSDLNLKLSHVFGAAKRTCALGRATVGKDDGFWHLDLFTAEEVASQAQRFIKPLCVHLDKISVFFKSLISDHDGVLDCSGVLNERTLPVARVQGLLLTSLRHLLAWPQLYRHQQLYTNMLRLICRKQWPTRTPEEVQELPTDQLLWGAFCYARQQTQALLEMGSAVLVVRLLEAIVGLARHLHHQSAPSQTEADEETEEDPEEGETCNSYGHKLGLVISTLLRRSWTSAAEGLPDRGSQYNQRVAALLQCWMKHSPRPLTVISHLTNTGLEEYNACDSKEPISDTFPSFNKGTLVIYMSCMQGNLSNSVKKALAATTSIDSSPRSTPEENAVNLAVWSAGVEIYSKLCKVIKQHHSRHLLSACLKYARPFLELFLSRGMPVLDLCLQSHLDEVCKLLKTLQSATRVLQIVCTESKVKKDLSLTSYVPLTRRSLATLVFRVKAMLVHHNCPQAFWLGVLKNKNLDGDLIATQADNDDVPRRRSTEAADRQDEPMAAEEDSNSRGGGDDESDSVEGLDLEDDDRSDVELDDDTSNDSKTIRGRKRKSVMESDDDDDNEPLEAATDYSASF